MKFKNIDKMSIGEILDKFDFSDAFIASYKEWCETQSNDPVHAQGISQMLMSDNSFMKRIPSDTEFQGRQLPIPLRYEDEEE